MTTTRTRAKTTTVHLDCGYHRPVNARADTPEALVAALTGTLFAVCGDVLHDHTGQSMTVVRVVTS